MKKMLESINSNCVPTGNNIFDCVCGAVCRKAICLALPLWHAVLAYSYLAEVIPIFSHPIVMILPELLLK
jgi:hypothetical protein